MLWRLAWKLPLIIGLIILLMMAQKRIYPEWIRRPISKSKYKALLPYVVAQVMHETGGLKSNLFLKYNNPLGFKTYGNNKGVPARDGGYYNVFSTPEEGIYHLVVWFERKNFPVSVRDARRYAEELRVRGYYTAPVDEYVKGLEFWLSRYGF